MWIVVANRTDVKYGVNSSRDRPTPMVVPISGSIPENGVFHRCGSTASLWFPFLVESSSRSVILHEEAVSLGRFGVLTFLYPDAGTYATQW